MRLPHLLSLVVVPVLLVGGCAGKGASKDPNTANRAILEKQMERQDALKAAEMESLDLDFDTGPTNHKKMGDYYLEEGNLSLAYMQYNKALRLEPEDLELRYKIGRLFLKIGRPEEAEKEFSFILERDAENYLAVLGQGEAALAQGDEEKAETYLDRALMMNDRLWQAHNLQGVIYNRRQQPEMALQEFHKALLLAPRSGAVYNNMGVSHLMEKSFESAARSFELALKEGVRDKKAFNNLGFSLAKMGEYDKSLEAFAAAGSKASAYNNLGYILMAEEKYGEAIESFERAIELNPSYYTRAYENLKRAQERISSQTR